MLFLIPVLYSLYSLVSAEQREIQNLRIELAGVKQIDDLMQIMLEVQQHRGLVNGYLNGNRDAKAKIEEKQQGIHAKMEQVDGDFHNKDSSKALEQWMSVRQEWEHLLASYEGLAASESFNHHSQLVNEIKQLMIYSADESGLTLDTDINSFYTVKMTVEELPTLIEGAARIRGLGNGVLASRTLTAEDRLELLLESRISEEALAEINMLLAKIAEYDSEHTEELLTAGEQAAQSIEYFLGLLDAEIINKAVLDMAPDAYFAKGTEAIEVAVELFHHGLERVVQLLEDRIDDAINARNATMIFTFGCLLLVVIFYIAFYLNVMDTVRTLKQRAEAMARGDFSQEIVLKTRDELRLVGTALNDMQDAMNRVLSYNRIMAETTLQSSLQLADISSDSTRNMQQVAASLQGVSEGTTIQERTVREMATALNEMSTGVMRIAEAASDVANLAAQTTENAEHGIQQLEDTVRQMASIRQTQEESSRIVAKLDEHSTHINDIIHTIMQVANQTRLLSLNASIEAARAGEQGRGFAVVAHEVGKLAEDTTRSAKSISELLGVIRSLIDQTVAIMDSMGMETTASMESIQRSGTAIQRILADIQRVNDQIQEVSAISEEMSAETQEVTASIAEVSSISHKTASEAEMMAASAEEQLASMEQNLSSSEQLKEMARKLEEEMSKFRLREPA